MAEALSPEEVTEPPSPTPRPGCSPIATVARRAAAIGDELAAMPGPDEVLRGLTGEAVAAA